MFNPCPIRTVSVSMKSMYAELSRAMRQRYSMRFSTNFSFGMVALRKLFNGVNIQGAADTTAFVYRAPNANTLTQVQIGLNNSSLASLVTGPPLSIFEMSAADGRTHREIGSKFLRRGGAKLLTLRPLAKQRVHPEDGVLGADSRSPQPGLMIPSYDVLIKQSFKPEWWNSNKIIQVNSDGTHTILLNRAVAQPSPTNQYELRQWNFSLFAGLAIQKYLSTLVSDQTPFDRFQAGVRVPSLRKRLGA